MLLLPSGDISGAEDTRRLRDAIAAASPGRASRVTRSIELIGHYRINEQIDTGNQFDLVYPPVCLHGASAVIEWVGSPMSDYAIRVFGYGHSYIPRLSGLTLLCNSKCRGLLLSGQNYNTIFEQLVIYESVEVGIDSPYGWCSTLRNIHFLMCDGYAMRLGLSNNSCVKGIQFHLGNATRWPAEDDKAAICDAAKIEERLYFTTHGRESMVYVSGTNTEMSNVLFSGNNSGDKPLLRADEWNLSLSSVHMEKNTATGDKIRLHGSGTSDPSFNYGDQNKVDNVYCADSVPAKSVIHLTGISRNCEITRINHNDKVKDGIMFSGGPHITDALSQ